MREYAVPAGISVDITRDALIDGMGHATLRDQHMLPHETSPQQTFARVCAAFADDGAHAQRLYDYVSRQWFMFATPILANGGTERGLPISCFLNYVADSRGAILDNYVENGWLSSTGGGLGTYWGALRSANEGTSKGSASLGVVAFVKVLDSLILSFSQGVTRRGAAAVYLDVGHPEIVEWLSMRRRSGGDMNRKTLNLHHGVCLPDEFMECVRDNLPWRLVDPHSHLTKQEIPARELWRQILTTRVETGEPYLFFTDTANRALPEPLRRLGLKIHASNLCTEIMLPTNEERTAVCCLSSVNLAKWDEWRDQPNFIMDLARMLDNALSAYIERAMDGHERAVFSASRERSIGLGAMGFHSFLQAHDTAFGSERAREFNSVMFKYIRSRMNDASRALAKERGEAPDMVGTGERFAHKIAVAPNATSALICGNVSPSVEPRRANAYVQKTMGGSFMVKNPELESYLRGVGQDTDSVWKSIVTNDGSVKHLDFLSNHTKEVFQTAMEIDQSAIIQLAAERQAFIDQGQSINVFVVHDVSARDLHKIHFSAWEKGLKALYYCRSQAVKRASVASLDKERVELNVPLVCDIEDSTCVSCQG